MSNSESGKSSLRGWRRTTRSLFRSNAFIEILSFSFSIPFPECPIILILFDNTAELSALVSALNPVVDTSLKSPKVLAADSIEGSIDPYLVTSSYWISRELSSALQVLTVLTVWCRGEDYLSLS